MKEHKYMAVIENHTLHGANTVTLKETKYRYVHF